MQPIKIKIAGDFWDCQIYRGWLYLWTINNEIYIIDWEKLVNKISPSIRLNTAINLAFVNGSHLYEEAFGTVFEDKDVIALLKDKFIELADLNFDLTIGDIEDCILYKIDSPFSELPNETEISNNAVFAATDEGLLKANTHIGGLKYGISTRVDKLWDCPLLSIKANLYGQVALSAGDEGLYQYDNRNSHEPYFKNAQNRVGDKLYQLGNSHSQFSNWSFLSIFNSSLIDSSYLSVTAWHKEENNRYSKVYIRDITDEEIFKNDNAYLSWGGDDKIYRSKDNGIQIVNLSRTFKIDEDDNLSDPVDVPIDGWENHIISAGTAYFGTVAESKSRLYVLKSDDTFYVDNDEVTQWKIYPKSKFYQNHLHLIKDDCIEILSFNHDFFLDQFDKKFGMNHIYAKK